MGYAVIRTDKMSGTDDRSALVSCRVYDAAGNKIAVENGTIVELKGYEDAKREIYKAVLATSTSNKAHCAVIASVEMMYDERKKNLDEFINEEGAICRGYIPRSMNEWSVTAEGFVFDEEEEKFLVPTVGQVLGIKDGKLEAGSSKPLGVCKAIEQAGRYTYYVVQVD